MIVVTGASGLLGSYIIDELLQVFTPSQIIAVYNNNKPAKIHEAITYLKLDLLDIVAIQEELFSYPIETIIHAAAFVSFDSADASTIISANKMMTEHLVNEALLSKVKKFIHISSIATLNRDQVRGENLVNESHYLSNYKGKSKYAVSKHLSEMEVWRAYAEGLPAVILNPGIIIGYHSQSSSSSALFEKVVKGLKFFTEGKTSFVTAKDVAKATINVLNDDKVIGHRFIISNGNYTYKEILASIAAATGAKVPYIKAKKWQSEILWRIGKLSSFITGKKALITKETAHTAHAVYQFDNSKFLNFFPNFHYEDLHAEINKTGQYYKKNYPLA